MANCNVKVKVKVERWHCHHRLDGPVRNNFDNCIVTNFGVLSCPTQSVFPMSLARFVRQE